MAAYYNKSSRLVTTKSLGAAEIDPTASRNWRVAREAVAYVRSKMTIGSDGKKTDFVLSLGRVRECIRRERSDEDNADEDNSGAKGFSTAKFEKQVRDWAGIAEAAGCGNCGEQADIAFIYLLDKGVRPLDLMALNGADHSFVVIGRVEGSFDSVTATWGDEAVVCDAWRGAVYLPSDFIRLSHHPPYLELRRQ